MVVVNKKATHEGTHDLHGGTGTNGEANGHVTTTNGTTKSLSDQMIEVKAIAARLHALRVVEDFEGYRTTCITAGLDQSVNGEEEADFYWSRHDPNRSDVPISKVRSNSEAAASLGIALVNADTARCRLLYRLVEVQFPDLFHADIKDGPHIGGKKGKDDLTARRVVLYEGRTNASWKSKLYLLFQGHDPRDLVDRQLVEKCQPLQEALGPDVGLALGRLLFQLKMLLPKGKVAQLLGRVLNHARTGRKVYLVGAFCPDYAYEATDDPNLPYRYTFDGLGTDVGLVALQFARVIPALSKFLTELGADHEVILGIGDFEADDPAVCQRVGCDYAEFVRRCSDSLDAFRAKVGEELPLRLELCDADRCKGRLRPYAREATERMMRRDFGRMVELYDDPNALVDRIVKENGAFYKRWYRPDMGNDEIRQIVLRQGGEYSALARIYEEDFGENVVMISGDRPMMHAFDALWAVQPVLCVKRAY